MPISKKYDEKNLVKVDGAGKTGDVIYSEYVTLIKEDGYDMSVEEACKYIGCTYTYFITRMINKIKHIRINTTARKLIYLYSKIYDDVIEEVKALINKRILLNRDDFFCYLKKGIIIEQQYYVFHINAFEQKTINDMQQNLDKYNLNKKAKGFKNELTVEKFLSNVISTISDESSPVKLSIPKDYDMPEKFYSLKELKETYNFKYDVEVYRMLKAKGIRKYILNDFVRYDIREIDQNNRIVKMDYKHYLDLSKKKDVPALILEEAIKASNNIFLFT